MSMRVKFAAYSSLILLSTVMVAAFIFLVITVVTHAAEADTQGRLIFEEKCQGCHSIGKGKVVGPDLKGITEQWDRDWLISFIVSPDELIAQGDPIATQLVEENDGILMPNLGVSVEEAEQVLAYIEAQSEVVEEPVVEEPVVEEPVVEEPVVEEPVAEEPIAEEDEPVSPGNASIGLNIFTGSIRLKNGGAACISCHNVDGIAALGGGAMAKDLTEAYSSFKEAGLTALLEMTPFPIMKEIYGAHPLADDEVANLVAFLGETADAQQPAAGQSPLTFIVIGIAGLLLIILIIQTIWRGRLSGVRQSLVKGGSK